jgi:hypothetical protein
MKYRSSIFGSKEVGDYDDPRWDPEDECVTLSFADLGCLRQNVGDRANRYIASGEEIARVGAMLARGFPDRPDMFELLADAVTKPKGVHELPYKDHPIMCQGFYALKEHWRADRLEDLYDKAVGHLAGLYSRLDAAAEAVTLTEAGRAVAEELITKEDRKRAA